MNDDHDRHRGALDRRSSPVVWLVLVTGLVVAVFYAIADRLIEDVLGIDSTLGQLGEVLLMSLVTSSVLWMGVLRPLHADAVRQRAAAEDRQHVLEEHVRLQVLEGQLHRALEMASTEDLAYRMIAKGLEVGVGVQAAELLLADSSDSHLKRAVSVGDGDVDGCGVVEPRECPAIRRAQTLRFESSSALDACAYLDGRTSGPCSGVCVPVNVAGRSIGVLHAQGPDGIPPDHQQVERLEIVATHGGARIGLLRVMVSATLRASTDPLTGMLNRRSFDDAMRTLLSQSSMVSVAMADLDHFKQLNDTHGHAAGDRALRLFAHVVQSSLRSGDVVSRYGGEEFVLAFPGLDAKAAADVLERIRESLTVALADGTVPPFTASFGVADTAMADDLEVLCRLADNALFEAKRRGRNQVVVHPGAFAAIPPSDARSPEEANPSARN